MSIEEVYRIFQESNKVCTDTRKIENGDLFFALKGENFNGNAFALKALEAGAAYALIDEEAYALSEKYILVEDVLSTLQNLATHHRRQFNIPVIGLTGSNGKTTNKELLTAVLAKKYKVHATKGNLNNHIGVPLTLLEMPLETEIAVIEMGANHQKEIALLSTLAQPTHGFITNIGKAHLEGFGGVEGIKKGKGELYDFLKDTSGYAFVPEYDPVLMQMCQEKKMPLCVFYGKDENALSLLESSPKVKFALASGNEYTCAISGEYNFNNIQTAYALGTYFNVNPVDAAEALAAYLPDNNRSQIVEKGTCTLHLDAYNANPSSMKAAIENFGNLQTDRPKAVLLGDMFELGEDSAKEHAELGKLVASFHFNLVVVYGTHITAALPELPKAYYFSDKFSLHNWMSDFDFKNYQLLIKGSRGTALETVLPFVKG